MLVWLGAELIDYMLHWDDGHVADPYTYDWMDWRQQRSGCLAWDPTSPGRQGFFTPCETLLGIVCATKLNRSLGKSWMMSCWLDYI